MSLTLIRMITGFSRPHRYRDETESKLFVGWFGPRGLASIVFAVIVVDADVPDSGPIATTAVCTIILSILAHGVSANPWAKSYGRRNRQVKN